MKGLSINPLVQNDRTAAAVSGGASSALSAGASAAKNRLEKTATRVKNRIARAMAAFADRLSFEEDVARISQRPNPIAVDRSAVKAVLICAETGQVLRLNGRTQQIVVNGESVQIAEPKAASWQIAADPESSLVQVTPDGVTLQKGSSVTTFISNDLVTIGQHRFVLKVLGQNQGANYVHC